MVDVHTKRNRTVCILAVFLVVAAVAAIAFMVALIVVLVDQNKNDSGGSAATTTATPSNTTSMPPWPPASNSVLGNFGSAAVAADNGVCSEIGREVMIKGGNAIDAIIATTFCIGVMDAQSSGLGGGHFLTFYNRTSKSCYIIDAREMAPAAAYQDMFANGTERGYSTIGIPGELYGLRTAYELYGSGRIEWRDLVTPTIDLCRDGYVVSGAMGSALDQNEDDLWNEPTMKHSAFFNPETNRTYKAGEVMKRPLLADTLELIANSSDPIDLFYRGDLNKKFIQDFEKYNYTNITADDFANYTAKFGDERPAILANINGLNVAVCGPPPPSSAAITIAILKILAQYDITPASLNDSIDANVETYHRFIEAMKYAYAGRMELGDMDYVHDALALALNFTSDAFAQAVKSNMSEMAYPNASDYFIWTKPRTGVHDYGTSHISVMDAEGNAASLTTTINLFFGSYKRSESTDIIWNDDMTDFSTPGEPNPYGYAPSPANFIVPGKRPLSSMCPMVVFDADSGEARIVTGGAGGSRIISSTANVVMRLLWFGQGLKEAVDSPRLHNQLTPYQTEVENGFPQIYLDDLTAKGQNFVPYSSSAASCGSVARGSDGRIYANSDYRKSGGYPAGY